MICESLLGQVGLICGLCLVSGLVGYAFVLVLPTPPDTVKRHEEVIKKLEEIKEKIK